MEETKLLNKEQMKLFNKNKLCPDCLSELIVPCSNCGWPKQGWYDSLAGKPTRIYSIKGNKLKWTL